MNKHSNVSNSLNKSKSNLKSKSINGPAMTEYPDYYYDEIVKYTQDSRNWIR